jgi:tetratricopeptide (TPR) repeat protein
MLASSAASAFQSAHRDVLDSEIPADPTALMAELKRRATAAVGAAQWPDAAALYTKAVECCQSMALTSSNPVEEQSSSSQLAIFSANLSLCHGKMNRWKEALQSAETAVQADATYVKGWWRRSQAFAALQDYGSAVVSMERALALDSTNTALQKELVKLRQQQQQYDENKAKELLEKPQGAETASNTVIVDDTKTAALKKSNGEQTTESVVHIDGDDETEFTKSDHIKGYKVVQGKKTSYFHRELSEDAARLIGDIAPQKLNAADTTEPAASAASQLQPGTSVWNTAGTWEEKDCSAWATSTLIQYLEQATFEFPASSPAPGARLDVDRVTVTSGHASAAAVRGKKRYLYEFDVTVHWKFSHDNVSATGTMRFPDVDGTDSTYDVAEFKVTDSNDATIAPLLTQFCQHQGLRLVLQEQMDAWVRLFRETY